MKMRSTFAALLLACAVAPEAAIVPRIVEDIHGQTTQMREQGGHQYKVCCEYVNS